MRENLRNDDKKRVSKELPELTWNPETQKEEVRKKEEKKERSRSKDKRDKKSPDRHVSGTGYTFYALKCCYILSIGTIMCYVDLIGFNL